MTSSPVSSPSRRFLLPVLFAPVFMVILDVFVVNVTAPSLRSQLGASETAVQWVVAAYVLSYALLLVTGGRLGDVAGRRRMFRAGIAGFTAASALCAAAPTPSALIAARVLQGAAAAAMTPQVLSIVQVELAPADRPRAFGLQGLVQGLAAIAGQIVGGGLIALDVLGLGWRSVFLINLPIGVAAFVAAGRAVPESRSPGARTLDLAGVALGALTLALLMIPAVDGRELGWPAWTFAALAAAAPCGALFVRAERRVAARGGTPLAELGLFRARGFRVGVLAAVTLYFVVSVFLVLPLYLQDGLGLSAIDSALAFTPLAVAFVAASLAGPRLPEHVRARLPQAGAVTAAAGLAASALVAMESGTGSVSPLLIATLLPIGAGMGLAVPTIIHLVLATVPTADAGAASGMLTTAQQVGNALGVAVVGSVFFAALGRHGGGYGDALAAAMTLQAALALVSAALVSRARERVRQTAVA